MTMTSKPYLLGVVLLEVLVLGDGAIGVHVCGAGGWYTICLVGGATMELDDVW